MGNINGILSERALFQRLNRKLLYQNLGIIKARKGPIYSKFGQYYIIDLQTRNVVEKDVDLKKLGYKYYVIKNEKVSQ